MLRVNKQKHLAVLAVLFLFAISIFLSTPPKSARAASPGDVVINELMYHPASDDNDDEFLELYNTTGSPIDLGDWCFTDGITLVTSNPNDSSCFESGTTIAANGYLLVSPNPTQTNATYGETAGASYAGSALSNGGENIELVDDSATVIDIVDYLDEAPWPTSPDGEGPSLELRNSALDNSASTSWNASLSDGGTPNAENSVTAADLPVILDVSQVSDVDDSDTPIVTAEVSNEDDVELVYKVMFEAEQTVTMFDDGAHGDGAADDGVYGASIPAQDAGELVRYKVSADNGNGTSESPGADESVNYYGYVVDDGQTSDLPIVRWYMDTADFTDMTTNHLDDDEQFPAVFTIDGIVFDNSLVRVKGQSSVNFPKRKYKFDLPQGYEIGQPYFADPVDEVSIQTYFLNFNDMQEKLTWNAFSSYGFSELRSQYVRVQKNDDSNASSFYGHYLLIENYDGKWRERNGYDTGAMYKQASDKKTRLDEDDSDIQSFISNLQDLEGDELKNYILDNVNVVSYINFEAISAVTGSQDWSFFGNLYHYRDTEGTGRWEILPWDLDNAMALSIFKDDGIVIDPLVIGDQGNSLQQYRLLSNAIFQFDEFKEMYYRRLSTLFDEIYLSGQMRGWFDSLWAKSETDINEDLALWSDEKALLYDSFFPDGLPYEFADDFPLDVDVSDALDGEITAEVQEQLFIYALNRQISRMKDLRSQGALPDSQPNKPKVVINEFNYNPVGGDELEYVELYNPNDYAVDISNWFFSGGVSMTMPEGSVIPAKSYALAVKNDAQFRSVYGAGHYIVGEYSGNLSNDGENIRLSRVDGTTASQVTYNNSGSWSSLADGQGYSQALIRTNADELYATCWAPSQEGGTPGSKNDNFDESWISQNRENCPDRSINETESLAKTGAETATIYVISCLLTCSSLVLLGFRSKSLSLDSLTGTISTRKKVMPKLKYILISVLVLSAGFFLFSSSQAHAATITVNSTADDQDNDGECTLREAIGAANTDTESGVTSGECVAGSGTDTINFDITSNEGAGPHTISPASALPAITDPVNINGYSETGASVNTSPSPEPLNTVIMIELDGSAAPLDTTGLQFDTGSDDSSIRGLSVTSWDGDGIGLMDFTGLEVQGNFIGTGPDGTSDQGNVERNIGSGLGFSANDILIGGLNPEDRNLLLGSVNNEAISASPTSDNWTIQGNYIGVDRSGETAVPNRAGFTLNGDNHLVGGSTLAARNIISGNEDQAAVIIGDSVVVKGNYFGLNYSGDTVLPNGTVTPSGTIILITATNLTFGGTGQYERNVVAGGLAPGIVIVGTFDGSYTSGGHEITNNYIGTLADGSVTADSGTAVGIQFVGDVDNTVIGGNTTSEANLIRSNGAGVVVMSFSVLDTRNISIIGNSIYENSGNPLASLGIDLLEDSDTNFVADTELGVTTNDIGDSDEGPNDYLNFPVIDSTSASQGSLDIQFDLDVDESAPNGYRIEFFANDTADASGNGEGQIFLGSHTVAGDVTNEVASIAIPESFTSGEYAISATTTELDNSTDGFGATSEFAANLADQTVLAAVDTSDNSEGSNESADNTLAETGTSQTLIELLAYSSIIAGSIAIIRRLSYGKIDR